MRAHVDRVRSLADELRRDRVSAVYLLGMGGSSLGAEGMRSVYGVARGYADLFVLDTTDEKTLTSAASRLDPSATAFLVASKSGTTIEVSSMERYFWALMTRAVGDRAGRHFVAITDPGTALEKLARERGYRATLNPPDIGGAGFRRCRFSAWFLRRPSARPWRSCSTRARRWRPAAGRNATRTRVSGWGRSWEQQPPPAATS
jgi:glucose-6-phosphate isomerase